MYDIIQYVIVGLIIVAAMVFFVKRARAVATGKAGCGCEGCKKTSSASCCSDKETDR